MDWKELVKAILKVIIIILGGFRKAEQKLQDRLKELDND